MIDLLFLEILFLLVGLILLGELIILLSIGFFNFLTKTPFVNSSKKVFYWLNEELKGKAEKKFYDLGSGDGSLLYFLAKNHPQLEFFGYEINPFLYYFSKFFHRQANLHFYRKNFLKIDFKDADYLYLYLFPHLLEQLSSRFQELKPGSWVISNSFPLKNFQPQKILSSGKPLETLYFYQF